MRTTDQIATPSAPRARSGRRRLVLVLIIVLALGAGAGGTYWWTRQPVALAAGANGEPTADTTPAETSRSLLPLDTFTVNLADPGTARFLRVTVQLVLSGTNTAAEVQHDTLATTRIRSAVLELLTTQRSTTLVTPEGKTALKQDIAARVSSTVNHEVSDVLFSDFVVQ